MSIRVESVASAKSFSLSDYIEQPVQAPLKQLFSPTGAAEPKRTPHLSFSLVTLPKQQQTHPVSIRNSTLKLPAGFVSSGGGEAGELLRLNGLVEEERIKQRSLEKKLAQSEQSLSKANAAFHSDRKAANARVAQATAELRVSREAEAKVRSELASSPAMNELRSRAESFKLQAEGAVAMEAEFTEAKARLVAAEAARDAAVGELKALREEPLSQTNDVVDAVSAQLAALHQTEVDQLTSQLHEERQSRANAAALVPEVQARLDAAESKLAESETAAAVLAETAAAKAVEAAAAVLAAEAATTKVAAVETAAAAKVAEVETAAAMLAAEAATTKVAAVETAVAARVEAAAAKVAEIETTAAAKVAAVETAAAAKVAEIETTSEARVAAAADGARRRVEEFKRDLPDASRVAMVDYETKVALIKTTRGRENAFARQAASDALHELTTGKPVNRVFYTREKADRVSGLSFDLRDGLPRTGAMAGQHPSMHTTADHNPHKLVAEIPKDTMEARVSRAVASIRVDLVGALRERRAQYLSVV